MENNSNRKTDRRTLYTRTVIKDALLELLEDQSFEKVTVTALCKQAEITRATFYIHYSNLTEVIDEVLSDALSFAAHNSNNPNDDMAKLLNLIRQAKPIEQTQFDTLLPACQRVANHPKYRTLFQDESLSGYIIKQIYLAERDKMIPVLMKNCKLSRKEADKIFLFVIYGAFFVNKSVNWENSDDWYRLQEKLTSFILGGFQSLK